MATSKNKKPTTNSAARPPRAVADAETGIVLATMDVTAPPARVYQALTDGPEIEHWWGAPGVYNMREWKADTRVGGRYTVSVLLPNGQSMPASGEFRVLDEPHKITHTRKYEWEHPALGMRVTTITYLLDAIPTGTRITVRHEGFGGCAAAAYEHADGWERVLGWLDGYLGEGRS